MRKNSILDVDVNLASLLLTLNRFHTWMRRIQVVVKWIEIDDVLPSLVPFVQFKKREKQPWKSITFGKFAG